MRPVSGYEEAVIVWTATGPAFEGDPPAVIGVTADALAALDPRWSAWLPATGDLRLLDTWYRQIGVDGPDVLTFQRAR